MHITALYAALLTLVYLVLTFRTIALRGRLRVTLGDGSDGGLMRAIRAHGNFAEYVPLALVLILLVELSGARPLVVHGLGGVLLLGRCLHAAGVSQVHEPLVWRMVGMVMTLSCLLLAAVQLLMTSLSGM